MSRKKKPRAKHARRKQRKRKLLKQRLTYALLALLITVTLLWGVSLPIVTLVKINGYAMLPTLSDGDVVLVNKIAQTKRFDLVCVVEPDTNTQSIRRLIGFPGEKIKYKDDTLYVNEIIQDESFIYVQNILDEPFTADFSLPGLIGETYIPPKNYLVLGDNRPFATDSRYYGLITEEQIIGRVDLRIFPVHLLTPFH